MIQDRVTKTTDVDIVIKVLKDGEEDLLRNVAQNLFDKEISPALTREFLQDKRHHLAVAVAERIVVGFASAVHYIHPDKPAELWINEVGVIEAFRKQGLAKRLIEALFELGKQAGCHNCWVLTEKTNTTAIRLYESLNGKRDDAVMFSFTLNS